MQKNINKTIPNKNNNNIIVKGNSPDTAQNKLKDVHHKKDQVKEEQVQEILKKRNEEYLKYINYEFEYTPPQIIQNKNSQNILIIQQKKQNNLHLMSNQAQNRLQNLNINQFEQDIITQSLLNFKQQNLAVVTVANTLTDLYKNIPAKQYNDLILVNQQEIQENQEKSSLPDIRWIGTIFVTMNETATKISEKFGILREDILFLYPTADSDSPQVVYKVLIQDVNKSLQEYYSINQSYRKLLKQEQKNGKAQQYIEDNDEFDNEQNQKQDQQQQQFSPGKLNQLNAPQNLQQQQQYQQSQQILSSKQSLSSGLQGLSPKKFNQNKGQSSKKKQKLQLIKSNAVWPNLTYNINQNLSNNSSYSYIVFDQNNYGQNFVQAILEVITEKSYYVLVQWTESMILHKTIKFFRENNCNCLILRLSHSNLVYYQLSNRGFKQLYQFFMKNLIGMIKLRPKLIEINFKDISQTTNEVYILLMKQLFQDDCVVLLRKLIIDNCSINADVVALFADYLVHKNSFNLQYISLDNNNIDEHGINKMSQGILERHKNMIDFFQHNPFHKEYLCKSHNQYQIPFQYLSLHNTSMTDSGLFNLTINLKNVQSINDKRQIEEYEDFIRLNLSNNKFGEPSLRSLGNLLATFNAISHLDISNNLKLHSINNHDYFFECLEKNYSLLELNMEGVDINIETYHGIEKVLLNNVTIQHIKFTMTASLLKEIQFQENQIDRYFQISQYQSHVVSDDNGQDDDNNDNQSKHQQQIYQQNFINQEENQFV